MCVCAFLVVLQRFFVPGVGEREVNCLSTSVLVETFFVLCKNRYGRAPSRSPTRGSAARRNAVELLLLNVRE